MKKIITFILVLIIAITISMFISNKQNIKDNNKIIVSEVTHSVFYAPWYVSLEKGYFKEEGLDIEVILTPGADKVATSVISGDAEIGLSGPEATIYVYNNSKQKLISFASLTKRDGQFIVGDCKLKDSFKMSDLIGKKVLAGRSAGMPLMMFEYALKESGIDPKDVKIDTSVDFASLSGAYIAHQGDFVNLFEPNALKIEQGNYGCVLSSLGQISGVVPYTMFYAKEEYINNNKEIIQKFNNALNKGLDFVHNNDSATIAAAIINQFPDTNLNDLTKVVERYKVVDSWYKNTTINKDDYYRLVNIMIYGKAIDKKAPIELLMTNEFNK